MIAYIEYGIDFDNNRFGFGRSIEIEYTNLEKRLKSNIKICNKRYYFRFWFGKKVFSYSKNDGFQIKNKNRLNFKLIFGVQGDVLPSVHLICGFMGFGKTTLAKKLETLLPAKRFTHDDIMFEKYGKTPDDFFNCYKTVDNFIKEEAKNCLKNNQHVILDYGFWSEKSRKDYFDWAGTLTDNVFFHVINCDIHVARQRTLARTINDENALFIDENCFNDRLKQFEPYQDSEKYPIVIKY